MNLPGINRAWLALLSVARGLAFICLAAQWCLPAYAGTYASAVTSFNWIDPSGHTKVSATSSPYKFIDSSGCGTTLPTIDDNISNVIPIGFNFLFGDKVFDAVRIMTNGRVQFVNAAIPWDNTTCGHGSPVTVFPIPWASLNYVMRIYGNDLDPTPKRPGYTTVCADGVTAANNPCYVSFAMIGTAPDRRFVVSWKGVPEWVSSGAKGAYDIQIILQEDGEFIYQYGPYVAGPAATAGQVGYQLSTTNYDVPTTGFPAQNFAIRFFVPHPLVEYLMEQPSWSGAGSVIDSSGNNKHGTPIGGVDTVAGAKVCRGADIPSNANTNNIDAIDTGLNVSTDIGSAGTIAFWYKAKSAWSGGGVQDAQLLDATVVNNQWFFVVRRSNGRVRFVVRDSTGTDRIAETPAIATTANTWRHIAVSWNFNPMITANNNKATVYVDGVQRAQVAFTSTTTSISSQLGTLYIGDNRSDYTGSNGTGRSADAVIDEARIYNYELSQQGVASLMNLNAGCLDHYAISSSGSGVSCQPTPITLTSHTSTHGAYVNYNLVNLSTSDNLGNWSLITGHGTLTPGPADSGTATYQFNAEAQVVLGLTHPAGTVTAHASDGYASDQENGAITITSVGCAPDRFNACHDYGTSQCKAPGRLYTRLAASSFGTDVVALNPAGNLDSGFTGKAVVSLIARATPGSVDSQSCFTPDAGGTQVLDNAVTSFTAGKLTVNANVLPAWREARIKVVCDTTHCPPSGLTACSFDNFAIRPGTLTIPWDWAVPPSATATPTIAAGQAFQVRATTATAPGDNYAGTLTLDASKLAAQVTSQDTTIQAGGTVGNLAVVAPVVANENPPTGSATYSEVGYLYLNPGAFRDDGFTAVDNGSDCIAFNPLDPTNTDYLSSSLVGSKYGCSIGNQTTVSFGRFSPYTFDTEVTHACPAGSFTYSGQVFPLKVTAKNSSGGITSNYTGQFANTLTYVDANGATGAFTPTTLAATSFTNGVADLTALPSVSFTFTNKMTAPATLKLRVLKLGGESSIVGNEGTTQIRSGRLRMANAFGSEHRALLMPALLEYYNVGRWQTNTDDSCTPLDKLNGPTVAVNILDNTGSVAGTTTPRCGVSGNTCTATSGVACNVTTSNVAGGSAGLCLTSPGAAGYGSIQFAPADFLQFNGVATPAGRAGFGVYNQSGSGQRIIERREVR